eukprot:gnl/TRDRNA2_/TRDRNA2_54463_c0_seq1.p1 gnl/TRDRNA2_/TRDRNA2_54463_c0~~gnl/TRDRNA2_/TRDRNA2_54463_c0_seq1.p1  ORF type:complete len:267 (+),score=46.11 gnl/TRDRNA2_/TRDRNA2_54463_c0_seq1:43-843(+)
MSDLDLRVALVEPVVQGLAPRRCCNGKKLLVLRFSALIGLAFAALRWQRTRSLDRQDHVAEEAFLASSWPARMGQRTQDWRLPTHGSAWNMKQPPSDWQPLRSRQYVPLVTVPQSAKSQISMRLVRSTAPQSAPSQEDNMPPSNVAEKSCPGKSGSFTSLTGLDEFQLARNCDDAGRLLVFKFYAPWCQTCRALRVKMDRMAREFPEVRFFMVNYVENKELFDLLGITHMPFVEIDRRGEGKLDAFIGKPSKIDEIKEKLMKFAAP